MHLQLIRNQVVTRSVPLDRQIEIGRCQASETMKGSPERLVIADRRETTVPRHWFTIQAVGPQSLQIDNIHRGRTVCVRETDCKIGPGESKVISAESPLSIPLFDDCLLKISDQPGTVRSDEDASAESPAIRSLAPMESAFGVHEQTQAEPSSAGFDMRPLAEVRGPLDTASVVSLVRKALAVVTAAAGSDAFLESAVRTTVEIVGLDRATILVPPTTSAVMSPKGAGVSTSSSLMLHSSNPLSSVFAPNTSPGGMGGDPNSPKTEWASRVEYLAEHAGRSQPPELSHSVLNRVVELRMTQIYESNLDPMSMSLGKLSSVVAAPIFDREHRVAAVLYGDRWMLVDGVENRISELEGLLVEVLAGAVSGGIARQVEEKSRANLSEFFSPRVASMLVKRPQLLAGRDAEVSVLFCDVRGFSAISETFGAAKTIELINDVLTDLSQCVVDSDGVLVDYVGDELLAMWGAPEPQKDHAQRALSAAKNMLDAIDRLRTRWSDSLGIELDVGIGINSGPARVGNVGSRLKFKYGVLGHTVNVGSRLQGACKHLGVRCTASAATVEAAGDRTQARRLAHLSVAGIKETVEVFECVARTTPRWNKLRSEYEAAFADFLAGQPGETVHRLGRLLQAYPDDRPSAYLLAKAARMLTDPDAGVDTVWELQSK